MKGKTLTTLAEKLHKIDELWIGCDHWKALVIDYKIDHDEPIDEEGEGLFDANHKDIVDALDLILDTKIYSFSVFDFGITKAGGDVARYLCGAIKVIEPKFTLQDGVDRYDILPEDISQAYNTGALVHPTTDEPIIDWESKVCLHYVRTAELDSLLSP